MSLFNNEYLETHHILPRREDDDYFLKNLKLLHKFCPKQVKYFKDRTLFFNQTTLDQTDYIGITTASKVVEFESSANPIITTGGFTGSIDTNFTGITTNPTGNKLIALGTQFTNGLASPEINKGSGDIIYIDNRPEISRNSRQKEDVKIILEF